MKRTALIGANTNPDRYAFKAASSLIRHGHPVVLLGLKPGTVAGQDIQTDKPDISDLDTVTLYVNPQNQKDWYSQILKWSPKRLIFNPGTENPELEKLAREHGIETVEGCTLVMLSIGNY